MIPIQYIPLQAEQSNAISEANILCLGNFDGVHLAHRTLLREAKKLKLEKIPHAKCGVLCFEKPSICFLSANPPSLLTTLEQKLKYFADEGMDFAYVADFKALQGLSPEEFINDVLIAQCACKATVCGYNYRFGKFGKGTPELLEKLFGKEFVAIEPAVERGGTTVSSTRSRMSLNVRSLKATTSRTGPSPTFLWSSGSTKAFPSFPAVSESLPEII